MLYVNSHQQNECAPNAQMSPLQHRPREQQVDIQLHPPMLQAGLHPDQWQLGIPLVPFCSFPCNMLPCQHTCCVRLESELLLYVGLEVRRSTVPENHNISSRLACVQGMCLHISVVFGTPTLFQGFGAFGACLVEPALRQQLLHIAEVSLESGHGVR